jgi:hypothetical protein
MWHQQECAALQSVAPARPTETVLLMARMFWRRAKESVTKTSVEKGKRRCIESTYSDVEFLMSSAQPSFYSETVELLKVSNFLVFYICSRSQQIQFREN